MAAIVNRSISRKSAVLFGVVFFLVITATLWLSYLSYKSEIGAELSSTNIALLSQIEQKVDMVLREIDKNLIVFLQEPELQYYISSTYRDVNKYQNSVNLMDKIRALMNSDKNISSVYIYAAEQKRVFTDKTEGAIEDFYDKGWLDSYMRMNSYSSWLSTREMTEIGVNYPFPKHVVTLLRSYPLISIPEFRKGVLVVNVDENVLYRLLETVDKERLGQTFVIDQEGTIVLHEDPGMLYKHVNEVVSTPDVQKLKGRGAVRNTGKDGAGSTVFYVTSPYNGWKYLSIIPDLQMNKSVSVILEVLILIACFMFIIAVGSVIAVSRYTLRPVDRFFKSVMGKMEKYGSGSTGTAHYGDMNHMENLFSQMITDNESMQKQIRESVPAVKWRMIMDLLLGNSTDYKGMQPYFDLLGIQLYPHHYTVMVLDFDNVRSMSGPRDVSLYTYALCNVAEEFIGAVSKGVSAELTNGRAALIMSFEEQDEEHNQMQAFQIADLIKTFVKQQFKQTVTIGVGRHYRDIAGVHQSYQEALEAIRYKMLMGSDSVISIEDLAASDNQRLFRLFDMADEVVASFRTSDSLSLKQSLGKLFDEIAAKSVQPEVVRQLCLQLMMKSLRPLLDKDMDISGVVDRPESMFETISGKETIAGMRAYVEEVLLGSLEKLVQQRDNRSGKGRHEMMDKVIGYMNEHFTRSDLSLNLLADMFGLSVPYMSKLFKEYTGHNFMDYLIALRMEQSKRLLLEENSKIADVAERVGYTNSHSFIRIFKKYTGQTPGEFKEWNGGRKEPG